MLGPKGNPQARNLFEVIAHLQRAEGLQFELSSRSKDRGVGAWRSSRSRHFSCR